MKRLCLIVAMCVLAARMFAQEDVVVAQDTLNHWLTYNIPGQTVIDSLGIPDLEGEFQYLESDGSYHNPWHYFSLGLTLWMVSDTIGSPSSVEYIKITDDDSLTTTTFVTTKGIRIGTPKKQVLDLYEAFQVLDLNEAHWDKPYDVRYIVPLDRLWIGDPYEATIIEFYKDKVFSIEMGYFWE